MANPNRAMARVNKSASDYRTWPEATKTEAFACAEFFRSQGYKVRESRFKVGPRGNFWWSYRVTVYYDETTQAKPNMWNWKVAD